MKIFQCISLRSIVASVLLPVCFGSIDAQAKMIIRHSGSDDPAAEGWTFLSSPLNSAGPIDDGGTPAWFIRDADFAFGAIEYYRLTPEQLAEATTFGWRLTANLRVVAASASPVAFPGGLPWGDMSLSCVMGSKYCTISFGLTAQGNPTIAFSDRFQYEVNGIGYHRYDLDYAPGASTVRLSVDGVYVLDVPVKPCVYETPHVYWGGNASTVNGEANYNLIEFSTGANTPPIAEAGPDQEVRADENCSAMVILDGSGSSDPDNDPLIYTWTGPFGTVSGVTATVMLEQGTHEVTLVVDDGQGGSDTNTVQITVADKTPPVLNVPSDIVVPSSLDPLVPVYFDVTATDNCDASPEITCIPPSGSEFPVGTNTVVCTAIDKSGNISTQNIAVIRLPLEFPGFSFQIKGDGGSGGSYASPAGTFTLKSTIPIKFTATCNGEAVTTGDHRLQVIKYSDETNSDPPIDATPTDAASTGNQFRYSSGQWHFNLSTKDTAMSSGIWRIVLTLSDGSQHSAWIQLK